MAKRATGVVKSFNVAKGFGFITPDEGGDEIFVHQTSIKSDGLRCLTEGESVEYDIKTVGDGKTTAVNVTGPGGSNVRGTDPRGDYDYYIRGGRSGGSEADIRGGGGSYGGNSGGESDHFARECTPKGN